MKKTPGIYAILITIFLLAIPKTYTERILTLVSERIVLPITAQVTKEGKIHLEESLSLNINGGTELLKYIKISIFVPNILKKYSDSFILQVFKNITPSPTKEARVFYGSKVFSTFLPYLNRIYLEIPFKKQTQNTLKTNKSAGEYLLPRIRREDFPILITIQPLMKGIPDYIFNHTFTFSITPEIENIGFLNLKIEKPSGDIKSQYKILIDSKEYPETSGKITLQVGVHQIQIQSDQYETTNSIVTIEPGKTTIVNIKLKQNLSPVKFETPENAIIYVDGNKLQPQKKKINLRPGNHIIRIKIEDYSITRKLTVKKNKHYIVSLIFDILLKEY